MGAGKTSGVACPGNFALHYERDEAQWAQIPSTASNSFTGALTLEAWVKIEDTSVTQELISKAFNSGSANNDEIDLYYHAGSGHIGFGVYDGAGNGYFINTATSLTTINQDEWYHVAAIFNPSTAVRVFVNGVLDNELTAGIPASRLGSTTNIYTLGAYRTGANTTSTRLDGVMDEVRISNVVRYTGTFTPALRFNSDANTMGLYHFNEGTGQTFADSGPNGNDGFLGVDGSPGFEDPTWTTDIAGCPS